MKYSLTILLALFLFHTGAFAQVHRFSNPISTPLHFNPAFAGSVDDYRVGLAYRNAGAPFTGGQSFYGSYDQVSHRLHGAIGFELYHDNFVSRVNDTRATAIYAGKFNLGEKWMFSPAIKVGYQRWSIDGFYYTDINDPAVSLNDPIVRHGLNFSPAVMLNTSNFYLGVTADQLASVLLKERTWSEEYRLLPRTTWSIQAGYRFEPGQSGKWSLAATGLAVLGQNYRELQGQLMYNRRWLLAGLGVQGIHSTVNYPGFNYQASLGFKHNKFRILGVYSTYSNQFDLSLMLYLPRKKQTTSPESSGR